MSETPEHVGQTTATRVTLSFSPADDEVASSIEAARYRSFLRRKHAGPIAVGDEWEEFVSRGCGSTRDVTLRVESVGGGSVVGDETTFDFEPRG